MYHPGELNDQASPLLQMACFLLSLCIGKRRQRKRILIVDDNPTLLSVLQLILQEEGYLTNTSVDASDMEHLLSFQPDLILLDILLSDVDGRMMSRRLKNQDSTKHIPIVLMTPPSSAAVTITKSGADDFLKKPFDFDAFLATIHKYV
jgi:DNA-binding response OmpR family regulator